MQYRFLLVNAKREPLVDASPVVRYCVPSAVSFVSYAGECRGLGDGWYQIELNVEGEIGDLVVRASAEGSEIWRDLRRLDSGRRTGTVALAPITGLYTIDPEPPVEPPVELENMLAADWRVATSRAEYTVTPLEFGAWVAVTVAETYIQVYQAGIVLSGATRLTWRSRAPSSYAVQVIEHVADNGHAQHFVATVETSATMSEHALDLPTIRSDNARLRFWIGSDVITPGDYHFEEISLHARSTH